MPQPSLLRLKDFAATADVVPVSAAAFIDLISMRTSCEDLRDKIYGLQSLLPDDMRLDIDYDKSLEQVFIEASSKYGAYWQTKIEEQARCISRMQSRRISPRSLSTTGPSSTYGAVGTICVIEGGLTLRTNTHPECPMSLPLS